MNYITVHTRARTQQLTSYMSTHHIYIALYEYLVFLLLVLSLTLVHHEQEVMTVELLVFIHLFSRNHVANKLAQSTVFVECLHRVFAAIL